MIVPPASMMVALWPIPQSTPVRAAFGALLLAMAHVILAEGLYNRKFVETWVNWRDFLKVRDAGKIVVTGNCTVDLGCGLQKTPRMVSVEYLKATGEISTVSFAGDR